MAAHDRARSGSGLPLAPRARLDSNEYLALVGALGVLVGLAMATGGERGLKAPATPEGAFLGLKRDLPRAFVLHA